MDQRALQEISLLLNAFPQARDTDPKGLLYAFSIALDGISTEAIINTARSYMAGRIEGQDMRFAPTPAEFAREARKKQEVINLRDRPRLAAPKPADEPSSPRVSAEKVFALRDALAGKRSIESVADEYGIALNGGAKAVGE